MDGFGALEAAVMHSFHIRFIPWVQSSDWHDLVALILVIVTSASALVSFYLIYPLFPFFSFESLREVQTMLATSKSCTPLLLFFVALRNIVQSCNVFNSCLLGEEAETTNYTIYDELKPRKGCSCINIISMGFPKGNIPYTWGLGLRQLHVGGTKL